MPSALVNQFRVVAEGRLPKGAQRKKRVPLSTKGMCSSPIARRKLRCKGTKDYPVPRHSVHGESGALFPGQAVHCLRIERVLKERGVRSFVFIGWKSGRPADDFSRRWFATPLAARWQGVFFIFPQTHKGNDRAGIHRPHSPAPRRSHGVVRGIHLRRRKKHQRSLLGRDAERPKVHHQLSAHGSGVGTDLRDHKLEGIAEEVKSPNRPASGGFLPPDLPLFPSCLQLSISLGLDLMLTPGQHVLRRDVADRTVQACVVVMLDVALQQAPRIFQRQWRSWPDALSFERFVSAFVLIARLRIRHGVVLRVVPEIRMTWLKSLAMNWMSPSVIDSRRSQLTR